MTVLRDLFGPGTWGTGGNMVAWVICGLLTFALGWVFRKRIEKFARWWHSVADNGFADEMDALRKHVSSELHSHHIAIHDRLSQQDELIRTAAAVKKDD